MDRLLLRSAGRRFLAPVAGGLLLAFVIFDNLRHPEKGFFPPNPHVTEFARQVSELEEAGLEERNEYVILEAPGSTMEAFTPRVRVGSEQPDAREVPIELSR